MSRASEPNTAVGIRAALQVALPGLLLSLTGACTFDTAGFSGRRCAGDDECVPGQRCETGLCAQRSCRSASDCGAGFSYQCEEGRCVVGSCRAGDPCGPGYECAGGFCAVVCGGADRDGDGACDSVDNCPATSNRTQADEDGDGRGDACDACPSDPDDDADGDALCGDADNCPLVVNASQEDLDGDGSGDVCDDDDDGDGIADPIDPARISPGVCGDGDADGCDDCAVGVDGFGPAPDAHPRNDGPDFDADGLCDAGDGDDDEDGVPDAGDACVRGEIGWTSDVTTDHDGDGCRDAGEDADDDGDGIADGDDLCPYGETGWTSDGTTDPDADGCRDA